MKNRPHKRWINRLAICGAILLLLGGGFVIWDHHDYRLPSNIEHLDPFADPTIWDPWQDNIRNLRNDYLLNPKYDRYRKRLLHELKFSGTSWTYYEPSNNEPFADTKGTLTFYSDGKFTVKGPRLNSQTSNKKLTNFERTGFNKIRFYGEESDIELTLGEYRYGRGLTFGPRKFFSVKVAFDFLLKVGFLSFC